MGFLDKVKAGVKSGAEQAATRAQVEIDRLQAKRDLQQAYADLGEKALGLADRGELSHSELQPAIDRARAAKADLDAIGSEPDPAPASEEPRETQPAETPPTS
jgi:hypothetical protein